MDHARHLSSPSPTSSFLFHHSERSSLKSSLLTPSLLSSASDVNSVDDCFSMASSTIGSHTAHNNLQNGLTTSSSFNDDVGGDNQDDHCHQILVSEGSDPHHHHQNSHDLNHNHDHHHSLDHHDDEGHGARHRQNHIVVEIDHDSLNGDDDDDDGMNNMLSGSSTSSTTTMPLLSDAHSDHPFSRISLEEYSPLSLVDDCDNALTISPASLALGSHHSFKSSLNNLKLDNLDGVDVGVVHNHVDDVAGDTRSMSPSMMSATSNTLPNHHLWSNSSTAITQNPALLTSSSTSFLLSHHHHHHHHYPFNTLMQQLEPPSSINQQGSLFESDQLDHHHRPSSEPPPGCGIESLLEHGSGGGKFETTVIYAAGSQHQPQPQQASTATGATQTKFKAQQPQQTGSKSKSNSSTLPPSGRVSSRKSRNKLSSNSSPTQIKSTANTKSKSEDDGKKVQSKAGTSQSESSYNSSKVHLQLNHHQKLWELQQRLFGNNTLAAKQNSSNAQSTTNDTISQTSSNNSHSTKDEKQGDSANFSDNSLSRAQATGVSTSSAVILSDNQSNSGGKSSQTNQNVKNKTSPKAPGMGQASTQTSTASAPTKSRPRFRQTPRRRFKSAKSGSSSSTAEYPTTSSSTSPAVQKIVATESVEPDTTTKTSDCIKLADLLATSNSVETNASNQGGVKRAFVQDGSEGQSDLGDSNGQNGTSKDERVPQIQLEMNPSLKLMTNSNMMQSIGIQQQQQHQQQQQMTGSSVSLVGSGCGSFDNQVLCRPVTVMTSLNGNNNLVAAGEQLKCNIVPNGEWLKSADGAMISNWSSLGNGNGTIVSNGINNQAIGTHQFAIQVICQDGTSLVLPVSSAAGLNTAVTVAAQNQLQANLSNSPKTGANQQQVQKITNQNIPLVSVANILAQQQTANATGNFEQALPNNSHIQLITQTGHHRSGVNNPTTNVQQASGLAASSPTLAALLDAGTNRTNNIGNNNQIISNNSVVPSSLLRKLVGTNPSGSVDFRRGEMNLQPGTQIGLTNDGSLVTICTTGAGSSTFINPNVRLNSAAHCLGDKRIKLENVAEVDGNIQTTFTLIEPQGLIVANGNEAGRSEHTKQTDLHQAKATLAATVANGQSSLQQQLNMTTSSAATTTTTLTNKINPTDINAVTSKQNKMTSSTGNRQVDPTQPFRCEHCNSTFTRLGNFTRHKKIHSAPTKDGQRFKCDVCSKSFLQRCDLARHLHIHRGTEPHRCNICGKGYIRHSDLVTHQRFHNKEKPFGCPHCSKGFCQRGDLNRHLRSIHLQMKPILCPCCNRKFAKQETLLRHLNTSHRS